MNINNFRESTIWAIALMHDLVTPWEAGRLVATKGGEPIDNPFTRDTREHDEWTRGYAVGRDEVLHDSSVVRSNTLAVLPAPIVSSSSTSFWAAANCLQLDQGLTNAELATRLGVPLAQLNQSMVAHHYYDADAIPLGVRESVVAAVR